MGRDNARVRLYKDISARAFHDLREMGVPDEEATKAAMWIGHRTVAYTFPEYDFGSPNIESPAAEEVGVNGELGCVIPSATGAPTPLVCPRCGREVDIFVAAKHATMGLLDAGTSTPHTC